MPHHPIAGPPRRIHELSAEQRRQLVDHLGEDLADDEVGRVVAAIDEWLAFDMPDPIDDTIIEEMKAFDRDRWARVARLAGELNEVLHGFPTPLVNLYGTPFAEDHRCPPFAYLPELARYATEAASVAPRPRGPRRSEWREELVSLIWEHYPESKRTRTAFGSFEETIALLFGFVGERPLEDLHREIGRILARNPAPPFVLEP